METEETVSNNRFEMLFDLHIYINNKKADWEQKSLKYFFPKPFKQTAAMKHGIEQEPNIRKAYEYTRNVKVVQLGLIVTAENPWLEYSPDGVTLDENDSPNKLMEIKCPFAGKTQSIIDAVKSLQYLNNHFTLKEKSRYFAQVQLGLAVLNLEKTDFILFASFDKSFRAIEIEFDSEYARNMLTSLKHFKIQCCNCIK